MPIKKKREIQDYHVTEAAKLWGLNPGFKGFRDSLMYDVIIDGKPYPPKAIYSISHHLAKLGDFPPSSLKGVKDGRVHQVLNRLGFHIVPKGVIATDFKEIGESASIAYDIEEIERENDVDPTERVTLIMARLGQGKYRKQLLALWNNQCAVTGCSVLPALRASHAKPWRECDNEERLDPQNGIPLVATMDALFDSGLIGFDESGELLVSPNLSDDALLNGIPRRLRKKPTPDQASYLRDHLSLVFQDGECHEPDF